MRAGAVGRVAFVPKSASNRPPTSEGGNEKSAPLKEPLKVGDWVSVISGWSEYAKVRVKDVQKITCVFVLFFSYPFFLSSLPPRLTLFASVGSTMSSPPPIISVLSV
jgi:hypothetical protein